MHRLAIGENDDAEPFSACFFNARPAANPTIRLCELVLWACDYPSNPRFADANTVWPAPDDVEVLRGLHALEVKTPSNSSG